MDKHMRDLRYGGASIGFEELWAIAKSVWWSYRTGNWQAGREATLMEEEAAKQLGVKYGILTTSGSCAGLLALSALELPTGSEVIIPATTFPTIFNIILQCGLIPVVVDSKIGTYNLDASELEKAISKKTKAIIAVHAVGNPCDMPAIMKIARKHGIKVIEDCCDSWGGGIEVDERSPSGILYKCEEKPSSTKERNTTVFQTLPGDKRESIIGDTTHINHQSRSIDRFGLITLVRFLKDSSYITKTRIRSIMKSPTSESWRNPSTVDSMAQAQKLLDSQYETLKRHEKEQNYGTLLKKQKTGKVSETQKVNSSKKCRTIKKLGSFGDVSITSFHAAHIVSMGVGGGVFTNSKDIAERVRQYRDWGRQANTTEPHKVKGLPKDYNPRFVYDKIGYNFQILELQAAMGRVQLRKAKKIKEVRQRNAEYLIERLRHLPLVMPETVKGGDVCWFSLPITCEPGMRAKLVPYLEKHGIETRSLFSGDITLHPAYKDSKYRKMVLHGASVIVKDSFWITTHPRLTKADLDYISRVFYKFFYAQAR